MMSSTEGLARLKKWQNSGTVVLLTSVSLIGSTRIFDVRVRVLSVDELRLVLVDIDSPGETEVVDLRGAEFSDPDSIPGLELIFADGKTMLLREE